MVFFLFVFVFRSFVLVFVLEIYNPPRVVKEANNMGMRGGSSLDFTAPGPDGYIWDFSKHECRQKAFAKIRECRPCMIIGSPECTPFSSIQNFDMRTPGGKEKVERAREEGTKHLEFCGNIYMLQVEAGIYFIHEHLLTATLGNGVHDQSQELLSGIYSRGPHVRIRHAVQGQARARVRKEADEILDQLTNVSKSPEQKMP